MPSSASLPKVLVKEIIRSGDLKAHYARLVKSTDLTDDAAFAKLAKFAADSGLLAERAKLLVQAYEVRRRGALGKPTALRALAAWCTRYGLTDQASTCRSNAAALEMAEQRGKAAERLAKAGDDLQRLQDRNTTLQHGTERPGEFGNSYLA